MISKIMIDVSERFESKRPLLAIGWQEKEVELYLNPREKGKEAPTYSARLYEKGHQMRSIAILDAPLTGSVLSSRFTLQNIPGISWLP